MSPVLEEVTEFPSVESMLREMSDVVSSIDDSDRVLKSVVHMVTRMLKVGRCSLMLLDPATQELRIRAAHGVEPEVTKNYRATPGDGIAGWVALHGRALLIEDVEKDPVFKRKNASKYTTKSLVSVPLVLRNKVVGVLNVNNKLDGRPFSKSDALFLETVANFVVISLEKARTHEIETQKMKRIDADLRLAQEIQAAFLPRLLPSDEEYEFAAGCVSAHEVVSDFYDLIPFPDGRTCLLVGDVCGNGVASALWMARVISYFRAAANLRCPPNELLASVNNFLVEEWGNQRFATACLVVVDKWRHVVYLYNAGHIPPYLFNEKSGELRRIELDDRFPLGIERRGPYDCLSLGLHSGESIVLYTDGITNATDRADERFASARLEEAIRSHEGPPDKLVEGILNAVFRFSGGRPQQDDQTVVVVRRS